MVSSPKDQEQGNNTEKQANPISIHNQLDYRHKQQSAHQEHNAVHSASSRGIVPHVDVQHPSGQLDCSFFSGNSFQFDCFRFICVSVFLRKILDTFREMVLVLL